MNNQNKILISLILTTFLLITSMTIYAGNTCEEGATITTNFCENHLNIVEAGKCVNGTTYICNTNNQYVSGTFTITMSFFGCLYGNSANGGGNPVYAIDLDACVSATTKPPAKTEAEVTDNRCNADKLFNWAESEYPNYFFPPEQTSSTFEEYYYRYYPDTDNHVGLNVNDMNIYVLGDIFEGQVLIDPMQTLMTEAELTSCADDILASIPEPTSAPEPPPEAAPTGVVQGGCVVDGNLMWEVKENWRHPQSTYTMYFPELSGNEQGVADGGECYESECDSSGFVNFVNEAVYLQSQFTLCLYSDWRLPSKADFSKLFANQDAARLVLGNWGAVEGMVIPNIAFSDCHPDEYIGCSVRGWDSFYGDDGGLVGFINNGGVQPDKVWSFFSPQAQFAPLDTPRHIILVRDVK